MFELVAPFVLLRFSGFVSFDRFSVLFRFRRKSRIHFWGSSDKNDLRVRWQSTPPTRSSSSTPSSCRSPSCHCRWWRRWRFRISDRIKLWIETETLFRLCWHFGLLRRGPASVQFGPRHLKLNCGCTKKTRFSQDPRGVEEMVELWLEILFENGKNTKHNRHQISPTL